MQDLLEATEEVTSVLVGEVEELTKAKLSPLGLALLLWSRFVWQTWCSSNEIHSRPVIAGHRVVLQERTPSSFMAMPLTLKGQAVSVMRNRHLPRSAHVSILCEVKGPNGRKLATVVGEVFLMDELSEGDSHPTWQRYESGIELPWAMPDNRSSCTLGEKESVGAQRLWGEQLISTNPAGIKVWGVSSLMAVLSMLKGSEAADWRSLNVLYDRVLFPGTPLEFRTWRSGHIVAVHPLWPEAPRITAELSAV